MISDNVDRAVTAEEGDAQAYKITSFLLRANHSSILIISRLLSLAVTEVSTEVGRPSLEQALAIPSDCSGLQSSSNGTVGLLSRDLSDPKFH